MFMEIPIHHLEGEELEAVDITLRIGKENLALLTTPGRSVPVEAIWLTEQPDGTYALGVQSRKWPAGSPRKVANNDSQERIP